MKWTVPRRSFLHSAPAHRRAVRRSRTRSCGHRRGRFADLRRISRRCGLEGCLQARPPRRYRFSATTGAAANAQALRSSAPPTSRVFPLLVDHDFPSSVFVQFGPRGLWPPAFFLPCSRPSRSPRIAVPPARFDIRHLVFQIPNMGGIFCQVDSKVPREIRFVPAAGTGADRADLEKGLWGRAVRPEAGPGGGAPPRGGRRGGAAARRRRKAFLVGGGAPRRPCSSDSAGGRFRGSGGGLGQFRRVIGERGSGARADEGPSEAW